MEKRLSDSSKSPRQNLSSPSRKSKRRSNRKTNLLDTTLDTYASDSRNDPDSSLASGIGCPSRMLWQPTGVSQNVPSNGQRLFAAMSDPSVCGYSPMPLAYTMQPVSLPAMCRMYQPVPIPNVKSVPSGRRYHCNEHLVNVCPSANNNVANGYGNLQKNRRLESTVHIAYQNGDYASLPPTANRDDGNSDELNSEHRRYSDPGLGPAENIPHSDSDDSDSIESGSSITTIGRSNKLVLSLVEQITELKKYNNQLFKELNEVKLSLEDIKVKVVQYKHNTPTDYQPGMLSELIREIRETNKNREEELVMKVKSLLEEKNNQQNQLSKLIKEKEESNQRITKLEEEVMALKLGATLEKLVEILRKKVNGAMAPETVSRIRNVLTSSECSVPEELAKEPISEISSSSSPSSSLEDAKQGGNNNDDDDDEDNDIDGEKTNTSRSDKNSSIVSDPKGPLAIENSVNLSGPVTDL